MWNLAERGEREQYINGMMKTKIIDKNASLQEGRSPVTIEGKVVITKSFTERASVKNRKRILSKYEASKASYSLFGQNENRTVWGSKPVQWDVIENTAISAEGIINVTKRLKMKIYPGMGGITTEKASGLDGILTEVLQFLEEDLMKDLLLVYNQSLAAEKVTTVWKRCELVILKKGEDKDPTLTKSYRPICLLHN